MLWQMHEQFFDCTCKVIYSTYLQTSIESQIDDDPLHQSEDVVEPHVQQCSSDYQLSKRGKYQYSHLHTHTHAHAHTHTCEYT